MMEKKSGKSKKGILFLILGTLAVIAGVMIFAVVTGRVTAALVESRYGGTATYVLLTASIPCIAICFVLLEAILFCNICPTPPLSCNPDVPCWVNRSSRCTAKR